MPTPVVSLAALQMVTPQLVFPNPILSVDSSVLPITVATDLNTTRVEVSVYNTTYPRPTDPPQTFTTVNGQNIFNFSIPLDPTVQEITVQIIGRNYNPTGAWAATTAVPTGYTFVDPNGNVQVATVGGITGAAQPTWSLSAGSTTFDGTGTTRITWTNLGVLAITSIIKFTLIFFQSNLAVHVGPPSAIQAKMNQTDCTLQWA